MEASATTSRKLRTFRSGGYLEGLMAELDRAAISIRMGEARDQAGFTQPDIADLLAPPVHFRTVQDWESPKKHVVPFDRMDEWARLTQVSREWLLYGEEASTNDEALVRVEEELAALREQMGRVEQLLLRRAERSRSRREKP